MELCIDLSGYLVALFDFNIYRRMYRHHHSWNSLELYLDPTNIGLNYMQSLQMRELWFALLKYLWSISSRCKLLTNLISLLHLQKALAKYDVVMYVRILELLVSIKWSKAFCEIVTSIINSCLFNYAFFNLITH